jgi:DNA-directed RNA polymerase specialized sigma subunit
VDENAYRREQCVLNLIYVWGWSNRDVAGRFGVNESRVSQLKSRALSKLRCQL